MLGLSTVNPYTEFEFSTSAHCEDMKVDKKCRKWDCEGRIRDHSRSSAKYPFDISHIYSFANSEIRIWLRFYLAHSANLPTGLCILPSVISSFYLFIPLGKLSGRVIYFSWVNFFFFSFILLWAKLSQYLLDRFSRSFHQMEDVCVNFLDQVQFFQFLKGRCHGNQLCVVSKRQTTCDFCNFYTIWKPLGCRW